MRLQRPWPCQRESVGQRKRCLEQRDRATAQFRPGALNTDADDYLWLTQMLISHTEHLSGPVFEALRASLRHGQVESYAEVNWV